MAVWTPSVDVSGIEDFFCAEYEFTGTEGFVNPHDYFPMITSFDLAFWDENGAALQTQTCVNGILHTPFLPFGRQPIPKCRDDQ